jgi:hypothetical protein
MTALTRAHGQEGIDSRGASRRQVSGDGRHRAHDREDDNERERIGGTQTKDLAPHHACNGQTRRHGDGETDQHQRGHFMQDHSGDPAWWRAEHGRYINFLSDFSAAHKKGSRAEALRAWHELKAMNAPKTYESWARRRKARTRIAR